MWQVHISKYALDLFYMFSCFLQLSLLFFIMSQSSCAEVIISYVTLETRTCELWRSGLILVSVDETASSKGSRSQSPAGRLMETEKQRAWNKWNTATHKLLGGQKIRHKIRKLGCFIWDSPSWISVFTAALLRSRPALSPLQWRRREPSTTGALLCLKKKKKNRSILYVEIHGGSERSSWRVNNGSPVSLIRASFGAQASADWKEGW